MVNVTCASYLHNTLTAALCPFIIVVIIIIMAIVLLLLLFIIFACYYYCGITACVSFYTFIIKLKRLFLIFLSAEEYVQKYRFIYSMYDMFM
jgi:hypothetical protein